MDLELINWVKDGPCRLKTLKIIEDEYLISSEIADNLDINRASASRILRDLKDKGLVSDVSEGSRTKSYVLTKKGKELLSKIKGKN